MTNNIARVVRNWKDSDGEFELALVVGGRRLTSGQDDPLEFEGMTREAEIINQAHTQAMFRGPVMSAPFAKVVEGSGDFAGRFVVTLPDSVKIGDYKKRGPANQKRNHVNRAIQKWGEKLARETANIQKQKDCELVCKKCAEKVPVERISNGTYWHVNEKDSRRPLDICGADAIRRSVEK